jgi:hypothetical protein
VSKHEFWQLEKNGHIICRFCAVIWPTIHPCSPIPTDMTDWINKKIEEGKALRRQGELFD